MDRHDVRAVITDALRFYADYFSSGDEPANLNEAAARADLVLSVIEVMHDERGQFDHPALIEFTEAVVFTTEQPWFVAPEGGA